MTKGTAVAKPDEKSSAVAAYDYGADAGAGYDGLDSSDFSIPFINVLQSLSPQVAEETLEGAKAGMLHNNVTDELIDGEEGLIFMTAAVQKKYVEWTPREAGGGFIAAHNPTDEIVAKAQSYSQERALKFGKLETPDGNQLVETYYLYGLLLEPDGETSKGFGVMSMTSTKIKLTKNWLTTIRQTLKGKIPIFAFRTVLRTVREKNDQGTYFNVSLKPFGGASWPESAAPPGSSILDEVKAFRDMIESGAAKADLSKTSTAAAGSDGGDEVPF